MSKMISGIRSIFESARTDGIEIYNADSLTESVALKRYSSVATANTTTIAEQSAKEVAPSFGKQIVVKDAFGDHPDFRHLENASGMVEHGHVTTLFIDIKNSTRLGLIYDLRDVYKIKNAIIQISIGVIQAFGGHVHRIMGDCVMGYFRSQNIQKQDTIIDAINAATTLIQLMTEAVFPQLNSEVDAEAAFGIRVGIDFGDDRDVLWGNYGIGNAFEVTATSKYVDFASKLQSQANKNACCIGENLRSYIDLPSEFLKPKMVIQEGVSIEDPYLAPNYKIDGKSINYRKWIINSEKYIRLTPLADRKLPIRIDIFTEDEQTRLYQYFPSSSAIQKKSRIRFRIDPTSIIGNQRVDVRVSVKNFGKEAEQELNNGNHHKDYLNRNGVIEHWETASFKGLHKVEVDITAHQGSREIRKEQFGIYIV